MSDCTGVMSIEDMWLKVMTLGLCVYKACG